MPCTTRCLRKAAGAAAVARAAGAQLSKEPLLLTGRAALEVEPRYVDGDRVLALAPQGCPRDASRGHRVYANGACTTGHDPLMEVNVVSAGSGAVGEGAWGVPEVARTPLLCSRVEVEGNVA